MMTQLFLSINLQIIVATTIILFMEKANEQLIQIIENLPVRLDRFWKARILRQH